MAVSKRVALVTGASAGMGAEFCRQLAARCDVIIAVARRMERLQALAEHLAATVEIRTVQADLCSEAGLALTVKTIEQLGSLDYLVNDAGFSTTGDFADLPIESQRDMLRLHCDAVMLLCRAALPTMRKRGSGAIINVSSIASLLPYKGFALYSASKSFLNFFSLSLQEEERPHGIRVQALCPGFTHTEFHERLSERGFDIATLSDVAWMDAQEVVSISLAALEREQVLVVPGAVNVERARNALQALLDALPD